MTEKRQFLRVARKFMCNIGCTEWQFRPLCEGDRGAVLASGGGGVVKSIKSMPNLDPRSSRCDSLSTLLRMTCPHSRACRFGKMGNAVKTFFSSLLIVFATLFAAPAFSANLPAGYTELEYVTFDGTNSTGAYVDTGLKYYADIPNTKIRLVADAKVYQGTGWQVVVGNTGSYTAYVGTNSGNNLYYCVGTNDTSTNVQNPYKRLLFDLNAPAKTLTIKNVETNTNIVNLSNISVAEKTNVLPVMLGAYHSGSSVSTQRAHMDLYSVKIYNNGTLVFDGVPAKYGNTVGIYDLVRGSFKSSASTALTAGPAKCRNLFDKDAMIHDAYVFEDGTEVFSAQYCYSNYIPVTPGQTYTFSAVRNQSGSNKRIHAYDSNKNWIQQLGLSPMSSSVGPYAITVTIPSGISYILISGMRCDIDVADTNMQLEQGSTATAYVPFCANPIKIATTAYNAARFSPVKTDLNNAVATIREIVTKTINQTAAIASLQADKQTRPEDACPAGKKCLLVEDNNGKPHWFPIIENICGVPSGYNCLDYIRSSGTAYIDTEYSPTSQTRIELVAKMDDGAGNVNIVGSGSAESTGASTQALMVINSYTDTEAEIKFGVSGSWDRVPVSMTAKNTFSMSATEFRVNDVVKKTFSGSIANTGNKPFYLFQRWRPEITSTTSRVQIYEFNIYENDVLVRHMVPAKQGTTVGMYDTVNDRFYTNAGTGSLTAGPEI